MSVFKFMQFKSAWNKHFFHIRQQDLSCFQWDLLSNRFYTSDDSWRRTKRHFSQLHLKSLHLRSLTEHCHKCNSLLGSISYCRRSLSFKNLFFISNEKNKPVGSLSAALVDNSSVSIKPYLKLMRLDRPIGKRFYK